MAGWSCLGCQTHPYLPSAPKQEGEVCQGALIATCWAARGDDFQQLVPAVGGMCPKEAPSPHPGAEHRQGVREAPGSEPSLSCSSGTGGWE